MADKQDEFSLLKKRIEELERKSEADLQREKLLKSFDELKTRINEIVIENTLLREKLLKYNARVLRR